MTLPRESYSDVDRTRAERERIQAEREALEAKSMDLWRRERQLRREIHAEAMLHMLEAVDPIPVLKELGLRDPSNHSEVRGLVSLIVQDVTDSLVEAVLNDATEKQQRPHGC